MEKLLSTWIEDQNQCHVPLHVLLAQVKAHSIYEDLSKGDDSIKPFSASTGWFSKFTKRCNFHNMRMTGEAASADSVGVVHYIGRGCHSSNPHEIHCFTWEYFVQFAQCFAGTYPWCKMRPACNTTNSVSVVFLSSHLLCNWPLYSQSRF